MVEVKGRLASHCCEIRSMQSICSLFFNPLLPSLPLSQSLSSISITQLIVIWKYVIYRYINIACLPKHCQYYYSSSAAEQAYIHSFLCLVLPTAAMNKSPFLSSVSPFPGKGKTESNPQQSFGQIMSLSLSLENTTQYSQAVMHCHCFQITVCVVLSYLRQTFNSMLFFARLDWMKDRPSPKSTDI